MNQCAMRFALLNVEVDVHVRLDICTSFDDSFIASAETKGMDWKTHELPKCSWGELPSWDSPLPIFPCSEFQRISQRIFWLVCSDHASAVSALALCFQRSLLLGFFGISTLSSIESWCVVGEKEHGKETCVFRQHFSFVIPMWSWFVLNDGLGFAIGSNCIGRWSGTFVTMHGLWCDANLVASLNWLMWFVESHVLVIALVRPCSGGVWPKFNGSVGMWFFDHFVDASQFLSLPNLGDELFFETLFCPLTFATTTCCANGLFSANTSTHAHCDGDERMILDLGLDMTLRPANLQRWEFQFFCLAKTTRLTQRCPTRTTWKCTNDEPHLYPKFMALSHSVRGRFGPSQFVSCEGHFVQRSNIFWEIFLLIHNR